MKHAIVEKRIAGIIRWLERLNKSYSTGKMENALMEAECAKADLETLRRDVWAKIQPEEIRKRKVWPSVMTVLRPMVLAVAIVMLTVVPLARDIPVPVRSEAEPVVMAQAVTEQVQEQKEQQKQQEQHKHNSEATMMAAKSEAKKQPTRKIVTAKKSSTPAVSEKTPRTTTKTVAYDKVFSLMQTGQRVLKNNNSVIKVQ